MNSSPASSFPHFQELTSDDSLGINRHNSLILFDRFSLQNANSVVFATPEEKVMRLSWRFCVTMLGTEVIVIDPEYEYILSGGSGRHLYQYLTGFREQD